MKKEFALQVNYELSGIIKVKANSLEEAMKKFMSNPNSYPLPYETEYVDDSYWLSTEDVEEMKLITDFYNEF